MGRAIWLLVMIGIGVMTVFLAHTADEVVQDETPPPADVPAADSQARIDPERIPGQDDAYYIGRFNKISEQEAQRLPSWKPDPDPSKTPAARNEENRSKLEEALRRSRDARVIFEIELGSEGYILPDMSRRARAVYSSHATSFADPRGPRVYREEVVEGCGYQIWDFSCDEDRNNPFTVVIEFHFYNKRR